MTVRANKLWLRLIMLVFIFSNRKNVGRTARKNSGELWQTAIRQQCMEHITVTRGSEQQKLNRPIFMLRAILYLDARIPKHSP